MPTNGCFAPILLKKSKIEWFNLSAMQGDQGAARNRDTAERYMTPAQIAETQKLAREWQSKR
jgi:hypothetical protein